MEKDEHDEDNSTRELDDFIAAERSSNTKGENTKYEQKTFEGYWGTAGRWKFLPNEHSCCCSRQGPWQVLKDVSKQNGGEYEPDSFGS